MKVTLSRTAWVDMYAATSIAVGLSLSIKNDTLVPVFVSTTTSAPADTTDAYRLMPGETISIQEGETGCWAYGVGDVYANEGDLLPMTRIDGDGLGSGSASEAFKESREFRSFHRFSVAPGGTFLFKFVGTVDFIILNEAISLLGGTVDVSSCRDATSVSGTWTDKTAFKQNDLSTAPAYTAQNKLQYGGTFTFGTESEPPIFVDASEPVTLRTSTGTTHLERGVSSAEYYVRVTNVGSVTANGCYYIDWEEVV